MASLTAPTRVQQGLNLAQAGATRLPCMLVSAVTVLAVGELAYRALSQITSYVFARPKFMDNEYVQSATTWGEKLRPCAKYTSKDLAIIAVVSWALGNLGNDLVTYTMGPAPQIYNDVLSWLGPVRIDSSPYFEGVLSRAQVYFAS